MLCDFYPIPTNPNSTNLGLILSISLPETILTIWVILRIVDEIREVKKHY